MNPMSKADVHCVLLADPHHGVSEAIHGLLATTFEAVVRVVDEVSLFESARGFLLVGDVAHDRGRQDPAVDLRHRHRDAGFELLAVGANLVSVDTGLVFSGPGLVKRINEAILFDRSRNDSAPTEERAAEMSWFWTFMMGAGMFFGSVLALAIAATQVVLPYDEAFLGMSRDDSGSFLPTYTELEIVKKNPFATIDQTGVGQLVDIAVTKGRQSRPDIKLGICGEHGGDPSSIHFFEKVGLDYVSCSPYRVPVARLAAAQAKLSSK